MSVNKYTRLLRWSLFAGSAYFLSVAVAHQIGAKVPGLFVYFGLPSHPYQDRIISALCLGWAVILGLVKIHTVSDLRSVSTVTELTVYWIETGAVASYALWITLLATKSRRDIHAQR